MKLLSVRGFSVFLMVLQLLTPLIHAHKNDSSNLVNSFHLPEFEQINQPLENRSAIIVPTTRNDQVVTVSMGIKNNKRRFLFDDVVDFFLALSFIIQTAISISFIAFFIDLEPIQIKLFNLVLPRAPPYFA